VKILWYELGFDSTVITEESGDQLIQRIKAAQRIRGCAQCPALRWPSKTAQSLLTSQRVLALLTYAALK